MSDQEALRKALTDGTPWQDTELEVVSPLQMWRREIPAVVSSLLSPQEVRTVAHNSGVHTLNLHSDAAMENAYG